MHSIDVLMTAFNAGSTIRSAVSSLLSQDIDDFRIIIVDDGSTDETAEILKSLAREDGRLEIWRQENLGIVAAANNGLSRCTSEFVARLDADDISYPARLRKQLEYLRLAHDCVGVSCLAFHIDESGRRLGTIAGHYSEEATDPNAIPAREPYIMHPFVMFRRSALVAVGGYRHVDLAEDADLYWRLLAFGRLYVLDEVLGEYRVHRRSITSRSILNGRISAINSQLSAISEQRRRVHLDDLDFKGTDIAMWRDAEGVESMLSLARSRLLEHEFTHLAVAMPAKLLELSSYRHYGLELADCRSIRKLLKSNVLVLVRNPNIEKLWGSACARLARQGHFREASELFDRIVLAATVVSFVKQSIRALVPARLRSTVRIIFR